jgi:hypothetical protein
MGLVGEFIFRLAAEAFMPIRRDLTAATRIRSVPARASGLAGAGVVRA